MDLFYNRLIMVIILLLLLGCQSIISNNENPSDDENIELVAFVVDYDNEESEISVYLELEDTDYIIDSIHALIINQDTEQNVATFQLLESNINSNLFLYQGIVSFISDDVYIYNISIKLSYYYCDDLNNWQSLLLVHQDLALANIYFYLHYFLMPKLHFLVLEKEIGQTQT